MKKWCLILTLCLLAGLTTGCRRAAQMPLPPGVKPEDRNTRLAETIDLDLEAWLRLPRAEQAKLATEWTETLEKQVAAIRNNPNSADLLPKLLPSVSVPILQKAALAPAVGFSLPPYAAPDKKDGGLALHYARHGDSEAAEKLAPEAFRPRLSALKAEKNYPIEWSRLVALVQLSSELKLSVGDLDGASLLVGVHRQLTNLLDKKTAEGPLGAALLGTGKTALQKATVVLKELKHNKPALAGDIEAALAAWGPVPMPDPILAVGAPVEDICAVFGTPQRGKAVIADTPERVQRLGDLLGLPLPPDGVQVTAAFLDKDNRLVEWQLAYRGKIDTLYPSPAFMAFRMAEVGFAPQKEVRINHLDRQSYTGGKVQVELARTNRSPALGAVVRVKAITETAEASATRSFRDFGPLHLDRGFESNRLALAPAVPGPITAAKDARVMQKMATVLDTPVPDAVVLMRDREADLVDLLEMAWKPQDNDHALDRLLPSLWDDYGPGQLDVVEDQAGSYLAFTWQDRTTRLQLRLAFDERGPILVARDIQGSAAAQARIVLATTLDEKERQARIASGKSIERLSRSPGRVNEISLPGLALGATKAEVDKALPRGKLYRRKDLPDGLSIVFMTTPERTMTHWGRNLLVRFAEDRVAEIRVRYQKGPAVAKQGEPLLKALVDASGAPETIPSSWAGLWVDLPEGAKTVEHRWRDDRTVRLYRGDASSVELILLDRPVDSTRLDPPKWEFVSTGINHCHLGDTRTRVEEYFKSPATTSADGASVYRTAPSSPYEMVMVWYSGDRVSRLVAVQRDRPGSMPREVTEALNQTWGKNFEEFGYIARMEGANGHVLGAYAWHDDRVRIRTSVQTTDQGPRIMTEWRYFPVVVDPTKKQD